MTHVSISAENSYGLAGSTSHCHELEGFCYGTSSAYMYATNFCSGYGHNVIHRDKVMKQQLEVITSSLLIRCVSQYASTTLII